MRILLLSVVGTLSMMAASTAHAAINLTSYLWDFEHTEAEIKDSPNNPEYKIVSIPSDPNAGSASIRTLEHARELIIFRDGVYELIGTDLKFYQSVPTQKLRKTVKPCEGSVDLSSEIKAGRAVFDTIEQKTQ